MSRNNGGEECAPAATGAGAKVIDDIIRIYCDLSGFVSGVLIIIIAITRFTGSTFSLVNIIDDLLPAMFVFTVAFLLVEAMFTAMGAPSLRFAIFKAGMILFLVGQTYNYLFGKNDERQLQLGPYDFESGDGHPYPSLWEEASAMVQLSSFIYTFADIRNIARDENDNRNYQKALFQLLDLSEGKMVTKILMNGEYDKALNMLHAYDGLEISLIGEEATEEELMYGIATNSNYNHITVTFRGTTTLKDVAVDAMTSMVEWEDPRNFACQTNHECPIDSMENNIFIHEGFHQYLFMDKGGGSKYTEIISQVQIFAKAYPRYKLYITGHSLGGALATLFGFYASASQKVSHPVTIVSVASPRVGNYAFARTFQEFESQGKIRHLRIVNKNDPVPDSPYATSSFKTVRHSPDPIYQKYYHTGIELKLTGKLSEEDQYDISYATVSRGTFLSSVYSYLQSPAFNPFTMENLQEHSCSQYSRRINSVKSDLEGKTLNQIYKDKTSEKSNGLSKSTFS